MCLAVVALGAHPGYPLVVTANRDEYHARAATAAAWGVRAPFAGILAGRDLAGGGTWLGVRRDGRVAFVTNVREPGGRDPRARSRGELVPALLGATTPLGDALSECLAAGAAYNGFNLLGAEPGALHWASNRAVAPRRLETGIHGVSNAQVDTPWPKLVRVKRAVAQWAASGALPVDPLFAALADRSEAADDELPDTGVSRDWERRLSAPFIVSPEYGTRCTTIVTIDSAGVVRLRERSFDTTGETTGDVDISFVLEAQARSGQQSRDQG